ncbi:uncharacterized protein DEA37_0012380, partial [Paragonimus westermani]
NKHTTTTNEDFSRLPIRSITEETSLTEFFSIAELANSDFTARKVHRIIYTCSEKKTFRFLSKSDMSGVPSFAPRVQSHLTRVDQQKLLKIPRRPHWSRTMDKDQLNLLEKEEMLTWRRSLAK